MTNYNLNKKKNYYYSKNTYKFTTLLYELFSEFVKQDKLFFFFISKTISFYYARNQVQSNNKNRKSISHNILKFQIKKNVSRKSRIYPFYRVLYQGRLSIFVYGVDNSFVQFFYEKHVYSFSIPFPIPPHLLPPG